MKFMGYRRSDGRVGIRNHVAVSQAVLWQARYAEQ